LDDNDERIEEIIFVLFSTIWSRFSSFIFLYIHINFVGIVEINI
jgi:hypothetical protein